MSLVTVYQPLDVHFVRGEGVWLYDKSGEQYLDALSGIAVNGLGHCHPAVTQAICEQAKTLIHTSNVYTIDLQLALAEQLTKITGMSQAFFVNSGAEANETAIKLAKLYGHQKNIATPSIIVMEGAFHGRTMATLTASGNRKIQAGFEPLVPGFVRAPFNDIEAIKTIADNSQDIVAILVEPIQGEGGIHLPDENYLNKLREICDQHQWLLMLDEVQTGNGRTGEWYAYQHNKIIPDVLTTEKGLGNGMPIGACLMQGPACDIFKPGNHGSTFGGNPLACQTASAVLNTLAKENLIANAKKMGDCLIAQLKETLGKYDEVIDIRGKGLMIGIELNQPCRDIVKLGLAKKLLFNVTGEKVIRLLPPLIIQEEQADMIVKTLDACIAEFL